MAYDDSTDSGAVDELKPEAAETSSGDDTYFLPSAMTDGHDCKPGDVIKLRVVGKDKDGDVEVEVIDYGESGDGDDWKEDARRTMAKPMPMEGAM